VPAGKAEILVTEAHAFYDCSSDTIKSSFQVDQDTCYGLAGVNTWVVNVDQPVHCQEHGDFVVTTYQSSDGSCTGNRAYPANLYRKGECISNLAIVASGPVTVRCPDAATQNIVELAESVKDLSTLVSVVVGLIWLTRCPLRDSSLCLRPQLTLLVPSLQDTG
jgi:hypothetical protein